MVLGSSIAEAKLRRPGSHAVVSTLTLARGSLHEELFHLNCCLKHQSSGLQRETARLTSSPARPGVSKEETQKLSCRVFREAIPQGLPLASAAVLPVAEDRCWLMPLRPCEHNLSASVPTQGSFKESSSS